MLEGKKVVDLVQVAVESVVSPVVPDHDVVDRNVGCNTDGVLDVQFL